MTKSRGNVVDPLDIMEKYGTDAVRFTLAQLSVQGRDLILSDDRLAASRAFANKIWNAARFVLMNLEGAPQPLPVVEVAQLDLAERWIMSRLDKAISEVTAAIDAYEFNKAALIVYQFVWHEFCDWYIELAKEPLKAGGERQAAARYVLVTCFDRMLRILHPFMPFISEEIWQTLRPYLRDSNLAQHLAVVSWPKKNERDPLRDVEAADMARCIEATEAINSLRSLAGHHPASRFTAAVDFIVLEDRLKFRNWQNYALVLAKVGAFQTLSALNKPLVSELGWGRVGVEVSQNFEPAKVQAALQKKLDDVDFHLNRNILRSEDSGFWAQASQEAKDGVVQKIEELKAQKLTLKKQLNQLRHASDGAPSAN
jgi:valyl-tRNA synthetase